MKEKQKKLLGACQQMLSHIARIGGALGFRLIFVHSIQQETRYRDK